MAVFVVTCHPAFLKRDDSIMRLIITGQPDHELTTDDYIQLEDIRARYRISHIVVGDWNALTECAEIWAKLASLEVRRFLPNWAKYGQSAHAVRNREMIEHSNAFALLGAGPEFDGMLQDATASGLSIFDLRRMTS